MATSRKISSDMTTILVIDCEGKEVDTLRRVMKQSSLGYTVAYNKSRVEVLSRITRSGRLERYIIVP